MGDNASSSRLRPFLFSFFFGLYLEKLEALRKFCALLSSHTYASMMKGISSTATV